MHYFGDYFAPTPLQEYTYGIENRELGKERARQNIDRIYVFDKIDCFP